MSKLYYLDEQLKPYKKHDNDCGWDLSVSKHTEISRFHTKKVGTGVRAEISCGYFGLILARSSIRKLGVLIEGVIDSDYRGEIYLLITNVSKRTVLFERGKRVAQIIILPIDSVVNVRTGCPNTKTKRGSDGFGSTN